MQVSIKFSKRKESFRRALVNICFENLDRNIFWDGWRTSAWFVVHCLLHVLRAYFRICLKLNIYPKRKREVEKIELNWTELKMHWSMNRIHQIYGSRYRLKITKQLIHSFTLWVSLPHFFLVYFILLRRYFLLVWNGHLKFKIKWVCDNSSIAVENLAKVVVTKDHG